MNLLPDEYAAHDDGPTRVGSSLLVLGVLGVAGWCVVLGVAVYAWRLLR